MGLDLSALDGDPVGADRKADALAMRAPLALFEEDPDNPRFEHDADAFALLVDDIRERGILQPIIVRRLLNGKLCIRFGARRYRAAVQLGLPDAPYVVTEDPRQFDDYAQVAENERRYALQPLELATFIARKLGQGAAKKAVAERLGIHPSALTHLLCLTGEVPPFLLELYHGRRCRSAQSLYELRRLWERDPALAEAHCAEPGEIDRARVESLAAALREGVDTSDRQSVAMSGAASATIGGSSESHPTVIVGATAGVRPPPSVDAGAPTLSRNARIRKPQVFGMLDGREVLLKIFTRPSSDGQLLVRFVDSGVEEEVPIGDVVLTRLTDNTG